MYDKVVTKVNHTDTSRFDLKTQYNTDEWGLEKKIGYADKKISDTSGLVEKQIIILRLLILEVKYLLSLV